MNKKIHKLGLWESPRSPVLNIRVNTEYLITVSAAASLPPLGETNRGYCWLKNTKRCSFKINQKWQFVWQWSKQTYRLDLHSAFHCLTFIFQSRCLLVFDVNSFSHFVVFSLCWSHILQPGTISCLKVSTVFVHSRIPLRRHSFPQHHSFSSCL